MKRLTRPVDKYPCRIANGCPMEEWIMDLGGDISSDICASCPVEKYINTLAMYEDMMEQSQAIIGMMKVIMEDK